MANHAVHAPYTTHTTHSGPLPSGRVVVSMGRGYPLLGRGRGRGRGPRGPPPPPPEPPVQEEEDPLPLPRQPATWGRPQSATAPRVGTLEQLPPPSLPPKKKRTLINVLAACMKKVVQEVVSEREPKPKLKEVVQEVQQHKFLPNSTTSLCEECHLAEFHHMTVTEKEKGNTSSVLVAGNGELGKLGDGSTTTHKTPIRLQSLEGRAIVDVVCGKSHTAALTCELYTWGCGEHGQLGHGDHQNKQQPTLVTALNNIRIVQVACGASFTAAVSENGDLYTWGACENGQLGHGDRKQRLLPTLVKGTIGLEPRRVSCGDSHMALVTARGDVYVWGHNAYGQLGVNKPPSHEDKSYNAVEKPVQSGGFNSLCAHGASVGTDHTVVWTVDKETPSKAPSSSPEVPEVVKKAEKIHIILSKEVQRMENQIMQIMNIRGKELEQLQQDHQKAERTFSDAVQKFGVNAPEIEKTRNALHRLEEREAEVAAEVAELREGLDYVNKFHLEKDVTEKCNYVTFSGASPEAFLCGEVNKLFARSLHLSVLVTMLDHLKLPHPDALEAGELQVIMRKMLHCWKHLQESSIERLNPTHCDTATLNLSDLLQLSNHRIETVLAEAQTVIETEKKTFSSFKIIRVQELMEMLMDNARVRRRLNDYVEGLLMQTQERLDHIQGFWPDVGEQFNPCAYSVGTEIH